MKLSVIIPVYNNEDTLGRAVESVLAQNVDDCEIIIVDDGSTDGSGVIADDLSKQYESVMVVHKPNGGPSDARNRGLDIINGDYVTFVDGDDELVYGTFSPLMDILVNHPECDVLEYSVLQNAGSDNECHLVLADKVYSNALDWLSDNGCRHCWMWNKIFKAELFDTLRFPTYLRRFEDIWMMGEILRTRPVIATTSQGTYRYYSNPKGLMATMDNYIELANAQMELVRKHSIRTCERRWHKLYMDMYDIQLYVYAQTRKIVIPSQKVVPYNYSVPQGLVKSLALDFLGLKCSCKLFNLYLKYIKRGG